MKSKESFFMNRVKSVGYAYKGALYLLKTEASLKIQSAIALLVTIAGFYFKISNVEWILQILAIALVMSIEGINTTIEEIANFIHPEHHSKIGLIKDISAGAVFIAAFFAVVIGLIIYIPKFF